MSISHFNLEKSDSGVPALKSQSGTKAMKDNLQDTLGIDFAIQLYQNRQHREYRKPFFGCRHFTLPESHAGREWKYHGRGDRVSSSLQRACTCMSPAKPPQLFKSSICVQA
jgi:hypothetical protein